MSKTLKSPSKSIREIGTAVCIFIIAAGVGITIGVNSIFRWIGAGIIAAALVAIITLWVTYKVQKNKVDKYLAEENETSSDVPLYKDEEILEKQDDVSTPEKRLSKNFTWIFDVPPLEGSQIQFATDEDLKTAVECCDQARADINYVKNFEKYKDIELNNIYIYIRKVLEWALKFVKNIDPRMKKQKIFFTIFDGKKIAHETDFIFEDKELECKWTLEKCENDVYTYSCKFLNNKNYYHNSFKKYTGDDLITYWKKDETTGSPFINKWAAKYPDDNKMRLIQEVCLDIYKTTSKVIHSSDDTRKMTNIVYAKYYKDYDVSDKAKALLVAKIMFHQVRFVLWFVAHKYSNYNEEFQPTDASLYDEK